MPPSRFRTSESTDSGSATLPRTGSGARTRLPDRASRIHGKTTSESPTTWNRPVTRKSALIRRARSREDGPADVGGASGPSSLARERTGTTSAAPVRDRVRETQSAATTPNSAIACPVSALSNGSTMMRFGGGVAPRRSTGTAVTDSPMVRTTTPSTAVLRRPILRRGPGPPWGSRALPGGSGTTTGASTAAPSPSPAPSGERTGTPSDGARPGSDRIASANATVSADGSSSRSPPSRISNSEYSAMASARFPARASSRIRRRRRASSKGALRLALRNHATEAAESPRPAASSAKLRAHRRDARAKRAR